MVKGQIVNGVQQAYDAVKGHPMCRAIHDDGVYIRVLYPKGFNPEGAQISYGIFTPKATALSMMRDVLDKLKSVA